MSVVQQNTSAPSPQAAPQSQVFYLAASPSDPSKGGGDTVFYKTDDARMAQSLYRLFGKEYGESGTYHFAVINDIDVHDDSKILLDEALDWLQMYDDPDPGVYDPPPTKEMMARAQFARRAAKWEERLQRRWQEGENRQRPKQLAHDDPALEPIRNLVTALAKLRAAAVVLVNTSEQGNIPSEAEVKHYYDARDATAPLVAEIGPHLVALFGTAEDVAIGLTESIQALVKSLEPLLPEASRCPGTHPVGKEVVETAHQKLAALMVLELPLFAVVTDPKAWRMPPDVDRSSGVTLLMMLAQAYYKILECVVSAATWCMSLELQLNQHYLWTINNLTNLLKNHDHLKDFPGKFEPAFPDLYPTTIRDVEWEDMVAPGVEQFLSNVQRYVVSKSVIELPESSPGRMLVDVFKDSISKAVDYAIAYNARMRQHIKKILGAGPPATSPKATDDAPKSSSTNSNIAGSTNDGAFDAEDSTIRGAIKRLKDQLRGAKMTALAGAISTGTFENRQYVIFNPARLAHETQLN